MVTCCQNGELLQCIVEHLDRDAKISLRPRFDPTPEPGNSKGLDLVLDAHTDQVTSSVTKPFQVNWKYVTYCLYVPRTKYLMDP